jgi:predicted nucleotidyltransferase
MELSRILEDYQISLLVLFGSYQTERFGPDSDIDVAYQTRRRLTTDEELELLRDFALFFRRDRIDLVDLGKASPLLMFEIARNGRPLYEEEDGFLRFKLKASARYAETRHLRQLRRAYLERELN